MGRFQSLSQVGLVLADVIDAAVPGGTDIVLNVPLDDPTSAGPAVRITLLWTTPQASHRNDPAERNPDGSMAPPPPTLSAYYVVSTHGATAEQNAIGAHDLLGQVIRAFYVQPTLELPIDGLGEGQVDVVQVPVTAEFSERIWSSLQVRPRPWVLFDVGPIQLLRSDPPGPVQPVVHPGGLRLGPVDVVDRPRIQRITPAAIGRGGRIRIDASYTGAPSRVVVGETRLVPPDVAALEDGGPVAATLPASVAEGAYDLTLTGAGNLTSEATTLRVIADTEPSLDAPAVLRHSRAAGLSLTGRALGAGAVDVVFWPDSGVQAPTDVVTLPANAAGTSLFIPAADLAPLRDTLYRISLQHAPHGFTPYVLLEMTP